MQQHVFEIEGGYADEVAQECHCLTGIDVRVKVIVAAVALGITIGARGMALPLAMLVLGVAGALWAGARPAALVTRLFAPFGVAAVVILGQLFFWEGRPLFTLALGPWTLTGTQEGLHHGLLIGTRVVGAVAIATALSFSTPFQHLLVAARWFRAPAVMVELASLIYRYLFLLREETLTVMRAQRSRLGYADYRRSLRSAAALCGMAFVRAYDRALAIHQAMLCRGYQGELHGDRLRPAGWREAAQIAVGLVILAVAFYLDARVSIG